MGNLLAGSCQIRGDRETQQDAMCCLEKGKLLLAAVCDGMGGIAGGERASARAVSCLEQEFQSASFSREEEILPWLVETFVKMDQEVCRLTDERGEFLGAGTTVAAALFQDGRLYWGSVGDSLLYRLRGGRLQALNRMHNYGLRIQELLARGSITEEEAERELVQGEALISYLGMGGLELVDTSPGGLSLEDGDVIVLCSDGLYRSLREEQIQAIIEESGGNMGIASARLCRDAYRLARREQDNTTVIAFRYEKKVGEEKEDG